MPFTRPSLPDLVARAQGDVTTWMATGAGTVRRTVLGVLSRVWGALAHGLYGAIDHASRQFLPDTADDEEIDRHARIWGIARRSSTPARGAVLVTGADGAVVPAGTRLRRGDGAEYQVIADAVVDGGAATVEVEALIAGAAGNATAGGTLALVQPIAGLSSTIAVAELTSGSEGEDDASLRGRVVARIQQPPHGGNKTDYDAWVKEVDGVESVWVEPLGMGPGTVVIRVLMTGRRWPTDEELVAIADHLDGPRPVTAELFVVAPLPKPIDLAIWLNPNTEEVRTAVTAELADLFLTEAAPGTAIPKSHMSQAISNAAGEWDHGLTVLSDLTCRAGDLMELGTLSFSGP